MNIYRVLGDRIGTGEARELAEQLVAWHDAMVKHLRVVGSRRHATCLDDCPHDEATLLWPAAQHTFGAGAKDLMFLRSHGQRARTSTVTRVRDQAAEIRA
jgi:hypothetical protein